jgi:uncharacterized protein DUF3105
MPPKPRSGTTRRPTSGGRDRTQLLWVVGGLAVLAAGVVVWLLIGRGDDTAAAADARVAIEAAGCTLDERAADPGVHSISTPDGTSKDWKTDPPTSGAHYEVPAIWGAYTEPVNSAQLVHNLEHGGIFILYGDEVPDETVAQLRTFYDDGRQNGTVLAPYPQLGADIALGAWVSKSPSTPDDANTYLARCQEFDQEAFDAFFDAFQFKGPERFPESQLLPGR